MLSLSNRDCYDTTVGKPFRLAARDELQRKEIELQRKEDELAARREWTCNTRGPMVHQLTGRSPVELVGSGGW